MGRTITIDPVTRIEGHARVLVHYGDDGSVASAAMVVDELRGFERILVGMEASQMPLITGRICGVCPSAHHLASVHALDDAAGVTPPPAAKLMRELLYMGHIIHSHTLGLFVLEGPDLVFGFDSDVAKRNIVGVVQAAPEVAKKALRLRTLGQKVNEAVGGRGVHPVTAVVGGMSFRMDESLRRTLQGWVDEAMTLVVELAAFAKQLLIKHVKRSADLVTKLSLPAHCMGTVKDGKLNFVEGALRMVGPAGEVAAEFPTRDYDKHLVERALEFSYMKPVFFQKGGQENMYRVGTLARINAADAMETPVADAELKAFRAVYKRPCPLTVMQIYARVIELVYACEKAKKILANPAITGESRVPATFKGGRGVGHVEAPRGTLIHDYEIDAKGIVRAANLIVATQQNYAAINKTIAQSVAIAGAGKVQDNIMLNAIEFGIRCYDPCLSCATHAVGQMPLEVEIFRSGELVRTLKRGV